MTNNLKQLREQANKTVVECSTVLGVTVQAIYNYESGYRTIGIEQVIPLAKLYDVSEREIIEAQIQSIYEYLNNQSIR